MERRISFLLTVLMCCSLLFSAVQPTAKAADTTDDLQKISPYLLKYMNTLPDDAGVPIGILPKGPSNAEIEAMIPISDPGERNTREYWSAKRRLNHKINTEITTSFVQNYLDENDTIYYYGYIRYITAMVPKYKVFQLAALDEVVHIDLVSEGDAPVEATGMNETEADAVVTPPTCTEPGYTTHTCAKCGDSYTDSTTAALGHDWDEGTVTKEPAETETGVRTFTCARCGKTKTEAIPVKVHMHAYTEVVTAPTCTEAGFTTHTCACGDSYVDSEVAAMGHDFKDGVCTRCEAKDPDYEEPVVEPFRFDDVKDDKAFYFEPVYWAVEKGVTKGTSEKLFSPDEGCTRAQVMTFLWRAAGEPEPAGSENPFKDVKETDYFYKAVAWAVEKGITKGTSADKFSPEKTCTRSEIVTFLYRAEGTPEIAKKSKPFADVADGQYYADAVAWAVENGVTTGKSADTFAPEATCTRGEIVTFLWRAAKE